MRGVLPIMLLLTGCASAEPSTCFTEEWTFEKYSAGVRAHVKGAIYRELTAKERAAFLESYNNTMPQTGLAPEKVGYFGFPGKPFVIVLFIERGCVWQGIVANKTMFNLVIGSEI